MCDRSEVKPGNEAIVKRPKQAIVLLTIIAFTLVTATSNGLYRAGRYRDFLVPVTVPGLLLMLIISEWKGRKVLFLTLFGLSLLSSLIYLTKFEYVGYRALCVILHAPVQGSAIALIYTVISEYCDPIRRFFHLTANSAIQMLFFWITLVLQFNQYHLDYFGDWMQYVNVTLGVFGLWSVFKWPESPYWLASKGRFQESAKALVELRDDSESEEIRVLTDSKPRPRSIRMFLVPILISFPVICMAVPIDAPLAIYDSLIIADARTETEIEMSYAIFLASKFIAAVLSVLTVSIPVKVPRKVLFLLCCGFYFVTEILFMSAYTIVPSPVTLVLEILIDYGPKIVTLPLLIETIPQKYVSSLTAFVSVQYVAKLYLLVDYGFPMYFLNLLCTFIILVSFIICYFVMPETREKSLIEIEQWYVSKKIKPEQAIQTDL